MQRRTFLKIGLGAVGAAAAGGAVLAFRPTVLRTPRVALQVLSEKEFSVLAAIADRISPARPPLPSAWEVRVPEKIDALLATSDPAMVAEIQQVLGLIESAAAGMLLDGRTSTFTGSAPAEQDRVLAAWRSSDLQVRRIAFRALNGLCGASYWSDPAVYRHIGYPGPVAYT
jgi:hypothetical protein